MLSRLLEIYRRFAWLSKPAALSLLAALTLSQAIMAKEGELPMKVIFRQTGGYAGPVGAKACELDTQALPAADAELLRSLVERSEIAKIKAKERPAPPKGAADFLNYTITVETDKEVQKISFDEMNVPESIMPLLEYLIDRCT